MSEDSRDLSLITAQFSSLAFEPRVEVGDGLILPPDFQLPSLESVRADSATLVDIRSGIQRPHTNEEIISAVRALLVCNGLDEPPGLGNMDLEPIYYYITLPKLFKWSYFVKIEDVPGDLQEDAIFALKMFIRAVEEYPEPVPRLLINYPPGSEEDSKYIVLCNARRKLSESLFHPRTNRPAEAVPYLKATVETGLRRNTSGKGLWLITPFSYSLYGEALALSGRYDDETKLILERALEGLSQFDRGHTSSTIAKINIHLAHVLHKRGDDPKKAKQLEDLSVRFLRKNPNFLGQDILSQLLVRPGQPESRILTALGGPKWLLEHKSTFKTDKRLTKQCKTCQFHEPQVKLFVCSNCKYIWYCSKECQRADWKMHKTMCREMAEYSSHVEELGKVNPQAAQCATDWSKWRTGFLTVDHYAFVHALGLHRDPSRSRTHIVFCYVEYTPHASKDLKHKFRINSCGVFRIVDVLADIEHAMGLDKGEGAEYIQNCLQDPTFNSDVSSSSYGEKMIPVPSLFMGVNLQAVLRCTCVSTDLLRMKPYNPQWRNAVNKLEDAPPLKLQLERSEIKDAEYIF
ncbi:hypothetical protein SERLA73DRAFT_175780 [Serpula lacrymans var. lacrymans S7.3]|uniref:MYND-type domain-containing protein n=2 Tax=Serpula lacrymans var. lacrymans TaxID=341189 RepID=F8PIU7_SERL3|nr:uncharacterized protein SERLADRAFT_458375 [Serpula lacrymans var. lacrymans S7.9]EGO04047.1 hypothetical protein SERLA73DRAFT_175780 [Serpula lacrymans var. lacrymans S7.3]EGO29965.1 hypothetical protein SERLADRAFT_458375 [Serpula lacrymans var. lacrymans S7.9]